VLDSCRLVNWYADPGGRAV